MIAFSQTTGAEVSGTPVLASPHSPPIPAVPSTLEETERLGDEIAILAAHIHAATWQLLMYLYAYDRANEEGTGMSQLTTAEWLSWRTGYAPGAARERVRVARLLPSLPHISEAMRSGRLSYSKVRALTRVATPENDEELKELGLIGTTAQVERLVRAWKRVDRLEDADRERERHARRELHLRVDEDGSWVVRGRLDPEVGAVLRTALDAAGRQLYGSKAASSEAAKEEANDAVQEADAGQRRADAIGLIAERALGAGFGGEGEGTGDSPAGTAGPVSRADRFQVIVHVDEGPSADTGASEAGGMLEWVGRVPAGTWRRLSCDASRVTMTHAPDGSVLDVGRRTRTVPPAIRRALDARDGGCRFPGCNARFADAHHIEHWADGGRTSLDNLVLLCRRHHRRLHEGGFEVSMELGQGLRFTDPRGRVIPEVPLTTAAGATITGDAFQLERAQRDLGIDSDTTTPVWGGESFDVGWTLGWVRQEEGGAPEVA